jgi:uncharacterized membrane protein AbrB (regulator of aidB expression)
MEGGIERRHHRERETREPQSISQSKEIPMNAIVSSLYRDLTCAAAALLISMVIGASFVQSTATAPGSTAAMTSVARQA